MSAPRLTEDQRNRIYTERILPDLFHGSDRASAPAAMIVAGQPGAGVASAAATLRRELTKETGPVVHLSEARLRPYHPAWRAGGGLLRADVVQSTTSHWFERIVQDAANARLHLQIEDELRDPRALLRTAAVLRRHEYIVQAVFVCTERDDSALANMAQYDLLRARGLPARFVSIQEHRLALGNLRSTMGLLEERRLVDGVRLIDQNAAQFYENRLVDGEWRRNARAQASLDVVQDKPRPPKDLVKLAMRWETLAQRFAHDPHVPRDVTSQVLLYRNEVIARCESMAPAAEALKWSREGAAFRVMERNEYEREFPHHARAVKLLGAAVDEAEKLEPANASRFVASARENIAQRIERGDMARIYERERQLDPPTR